MDAGLGALIMMSRSGVRSDVISRNAAISACVKGSEWTRVTGLEHDGGERHPSGYYHLHCGHECLWERWYVGTCCNR